MNDPDSLSGARAALNLTARLPASRGEGQVILVTSAASGEGKSFVSQLLAHNLSRLGDGGVALVLTAEDAGDMRTASASGRAEASLAALIATGLLADSSALAAIGPRLHRLPAGAAAQPAALFQAAGVARAMTALRGRFRYSVVDGANLEACGALLHEVDGVALVVDARHTSPQTIERALRRADVEARRLTGVLLNHAPSGLPAWLGGD